MKNAPLSIGRVFTPVSPDDLVITLISFSEKSRREGLLALEDDLDEIEDELMVKLLQLVVDGTDPDLVRKIGEAELSMSVYYMEEIHEALLFLMVNRDREDIGEMFRHFVLSLDLEGSLEEIFRLGEELLDIISSDHDFNEDTPPRLAAMIELIRYGATPEDEGELLENHFHTLIEQHRRSRRIILEGVLNIQSGNNPRVVMDELSAYLDAPSRRRVRNFTDPGPGSEDGADDGSGVQGDDAGER